MERRLALPGLAAVAFLSAGCQVACGSDATGRAASARSHASRAAESADAGALPASLTAGAGEETERLETLEQAVETAPSDPQAHRRLAVALHRLKRREEAVRHFERALALDPSERSLLDLALAYGSVARYDESEATYRRVLERHPDHAVALHNLANLAFKRGRTEESIDAYRRAIAARPNYVLAHYHLGDALRRAGRYAEAYRAYENVLTLSPESAQDAAAYDDALYNLAVLDLDMGATERAERMLGELVRANPKHPKAFYAYARVLLQLGRPEEAQRALATHARLMAAREPTAAVATGD